MRTPQNICSMLLLTVVTALLCPEVSLSQGFLQEQELAPPGLESSDFFGYSVSISGDYVAVGVELDDHDGLLNVGTVRIYVRNQTTWEHVAVVLPDDKSENLNFGWSVSLYDRYLLVGAHYSAYIFYREDDGSWTQQAKWSNGDIYFGKELVIYGRWAMVSLATSTVGASRVFAYYRDDEGTWSLRNELAPNDVSNGFFGQSIAIDGRYMIVSDRNYADNVNYSDNNYYRGRAYIYYLNDDNLWTEKAQIKGSDFNSKYGEFVGLEGQYAFVSDPNNLFVYERTHPEWSDTEIWTGIQEIPEAYGHLVAEGKYLLVGLNSGNLLRFYASTSEGQFNLVSEMNKNSNEDIGFHGNYAITGDPFKDSVGATRSGAAYVYKMLYADIAIEPSPVNFGPLDVTDVSDTTIIIQSTGVSDAIIDSVHLVQGVNGFSFNGPSQNIIPANGSENMVIHFSPPDTGAFADTLIISHNGDSSPTRVFLLGEGTRPELTAGTDVPEDPHIDFGTVNIYEPDHLEHGPGIYDLRIFNTGTGLLKIHDLEITGSDSALFSVSGPVNQPISPQDTVALRLKFDPESVGPKTANLRLYHNAPDSVTVISLKGAGRPPFVVFSHSNLNFGEVPVSTTGTGGLWIYNNSVSLLNITGRTITVPPDTDHQFSLPQHADPVVPGDSSFIDVFFSPTSGGATTADLLINHDGEGSSHNVNLSGHGLTDPVLSLGSGSGAPGFLATVPLELINTEPAPIAAFQFHIVINDTSVAKFESVESLLDTLSFTILTATHDDTIRFVISPTLNTLVPSLATLATQKVANLLFRVSPSAQDGGTVPLRILNTFASDTLFQEIPLISRNGAVHVEAVRRGDLTGDGKVNVADVVKLILQILNVLPIPEPETSSFVRSDVNADGEINILDVVHQIRIILGLATKTLAAGPSSPVVIGLGDLTQSTGNKYLVPLEMHSDGQIAALNFAVDINSDGISVGQVVLSDRAADMTVRSHFTDGTLRIVIFSVEGHGISAGSGPVAYIPITLNSGISVSQGLKLSTAIAANYFAESVTVTLKDAGEGHTNLPNTFSLSNATPNPFNPSTTIAYEVPEQTHITLTIYNLLGQEVVRLVDQAQAAGRYETVWQGVNSRGAGVASGVYLYRIVSGSGYTDTKRMTLLK